MDVTEEEPNDPEAGDLQSSPTRTAENKLPDVLCGLCSYSGPLQSIDIHHTSRHKVYLITSGNMHLK